MRMTLRRCLIILLTIRFTAAFISCFLPLNFPHLWRQTDTMGVALRYWLRWTVEKSVQSPLYPAVLNSRDHYGITPMEFPFLNIISAPFFYFGPYWGRVTSHLFLCFILLFLIIANIKIWKNSLIQNIPVFEMLLLTPVRCKSPFVT